MVLEVTNIHKSFGGLIALQNISFSVGQGEILGVMGANGAGKTTLFSIISGHTKPTHGAVFLEGKQIHKLRPDQVNNSGIARTYQIVRPFRGLTVLENVNIGVLYGSGQEKSVHLAKRRSMEILSDTNLGGRANDIAGSLTLAGFKRLELAKAIATAPKILLLDEIMAGLNSSEVTQALNILETCRDKYNLTIIVIEHVMKALMRMCERIVVLHQGQMIATGSASHIANNKTVMQAYLGEKH
jgi:branched-chain amino acid transport system ATP-binding protein